MLFFFVRGCGCGSLISTEGMRASSSVKAVGRSVHSMRGWMRGVAGWILAFCSCLPFVGVSECLWSCLWSVSASVRGREGGRASDLGVNQ